VGYCSEGSGHARHSHLNLAAQHNNGPLRRSQELGSARKDLHCAKFLCRVKNIDGRPPPDGLLFQEGHVIAAIGVALGLVVPGVQQHIAADAQQSYRVGIAFFCPRHSDHRHDLSHLY
jgi:hypothetical protein